MNQALIFLTYDIFALFDNFLFEIYLYYQREKSSKLAQNLSIKAPILESY